ncbi:hypothetical protein SAMN02745163_03117 [Clostridium cavendishii DSM 21758]|uniref:PsbP protein n=1 Tax=Clostridium cavendishii DSM 21758 TaxID=1121302 RepID=A0A1M6PDD2_9CLOT|nr:hypothetical protein [Clostridium cavendishii]SHK05978.1 hypothetical protein SAMN02745163_03117 [Clostridium cavendishii DSM 21758]
MEKFMNKKQLKVTLILIGLMIVLVASESIFSNKMKFVALMNNNISDLKKYEAMDNKYTYNIPTLWNAQEKKYPGNYIVYDNDFKSDDMGIFGSVQVINTPKSVAEVIEEEKNTFVDNGDYKNTKEKINDINMNKVRFSNNLDGKKNFVNTIYYFQTEKNNVIKISFKCNKDKYKENYDTIYKVIVESFKKSK